MTTMPKRWPLAVGTIFALVLLSMNPTPSSAAAPSPIKWFPNDVTVTTAASDQLAPNIAYGAGIYLAVWADRRADPVGILYNSVETGYDIYAMRLDANGNRIDAMPFVVTQAAADQTSPQVVWNGTNWLVVWDDYGVSGTGIYYSRYVRGARVSPTGAVLDPTPTTLLSSSSSGAMWAVASDGNNWALVSQGTSSGDNDIVGMLISPQGTKVNAAPVVIVPRQYYLRFDLRVAYASGTYLVAWKDLNDLQGIRLGQDLHPLAAPFTIVANNSGSVQLGASNDGFFAVWTAQRPNFTVGVFGARINAAGAILDPGGIDISLANLPRSLPQAGWDGVNWRVTWASQAGLSIARVAATGALLDPGGTAVGVSNTGPVAVAPGGSIQMAWSASISPTMAPYDVHTVNIGAGFSAGAEIALSLAAPSQTQSDLASNGNGWLAAYVSTISGQQRLLAQAFDAVGNPIGGPRELDRGQTASGPTEPAVAWNGTNFLVTWASIERGSGGLGAIMAQRLNANGTFIDAQPFVVMPGASPDVAALGDVFLVVGTNWTYGSHFVLPFSMRLRGSDAALLDAAPVLLGQYFARWPAVTTISNRWFVAFQRNVSHDNPRANLYGTFVDASGAPAGEFLLNGLWTSTKYRGPHLASKGDAALLVWEDERTSATETDILGQMVLADGATLPEVLISGQPGNQFQTDVAWDGSQFLVVYQDQRNRTSELDIMDSRSDLFATRLDANANVIDPAGFAFSARTGGEIHPTVAGANGSTLIAGSVLRTEAPFVSYRIGYELMGQNGQRPVVVAGGTPSSGDSPLSVNFDTTGSFDLDGSIVSYLWDFADGGSSTAANPSHRYADAGDYVANVTLTDDRGVQSRNSVHTQVSSPNQLPVAKASADRTAGPTPLYVVFSAAGSYDPDGPLGNIHWDFGDGGIYWGGTAYHTFSTSGMHTVTLTVYDSRGATGTDTLVINAGVANVPPVAVAAATPVAGEAPLAVNFSSAGSHDPDGVIASYRWTFGNGASSTQANPTYTYTNAGTYQSTLTVTDGNNATSSDEVTIMVAQGACATNCVRSDSVALSGTVKRGKVSVTGSVKVVDQSGRAMSAATVSAQWRLPDGSLQTTSVSTNRKGIARFSAASGRGTYTLTVTGISRSGYQFDPDNSELSASITM